MTRILKGTVRAIVRYFGFDIVRYHASPHRTVIGLTEFPIDLIVDVGANTGQFARYISVRFPNAQIFCFEPLAEPYEALERWADSQGGRVICRNVALSDQTYTATMHEHIYHSPSSSLLEATELSHTLYPQTRGERLVPVKVSTLDEEFANVDLRTVGNILLKLDVQGLEDKVLLGGQQLLKFCTAVLLEVSLMPVYEGQADFVDLVNVLGRAGLKYAGNVDQNYDQAGRVVFLDALFVKG